MPMSRYEIRNEYSLADTELYRAANKDDPEALLEGVAMAGLIGVLRQLGDLAEFAAEIFRNLHEEVMATAARGHGLSIRVQQLETEVPSIERAFFSHTDHSSCFHHAGVDWHPNLRIDQNLVTQGDLPQFIMDSYEECRAPPRLFLLDKFDVAGAGACLKRYSDPSFFKVETSEMISADVQREKKIRKAKKKPRWRNGETTEVSRTSHTKLDQLFLEERAENGVSCPSRHAKLKRRLNGFPFDSKMGKSYMEKLLKSPSPDQKVLYEVTVNSSPLMSAINDHKDSGFEIFEARPVTPDSESGGRKRSPPSSPDREEITLNPSMYEPNESPIDDKICEVPNSYPCNRTYGIPCTLDVVTGEEVVAANAESNTEDNLTGYQSDDIASEVDNYEDAPSTMESEIDRDSELTVMSDINSSHIKSESLILDADEEHIQTRSSDSQSTGDSMISDKGNNSSAKEMSSVSYDSPRTSAENPQLEGFQCADIPVIEIVDAPSYQKTADEDIPVDHHSKPVVSDDSCTDTGAITNHRSRFEQLTSILCIDASIPNLADSESEEVVRKYISKSPESGEMVSTLDDEEKKTNLVLEPPCSPCVCGFESQPKEDSPGSSSGEHVMDEPRGEGIPCISALPYIHCHTKDSSVITSSGSPHEYESEGGNLNWVEDIASTSNLHNVLSKDGTPGTISLENLIPGKLEDEFPEVPEQSPNYLDIGHNGDNIWSAVCKGDKLIDVLDNDDSNVATDSPNDFSCIMEASAGEKLEETTLANAHIVNVEDHHSNGSTDNQVSSENLKLSDLANSPDRPTESLYAYEGDVISQEETTVNEALVFGTPKSCEVIGLQGTGITHHVSLNDSVALESSCCNPEDVEEPAGASDAIEMDGISLCSIFGGREVTEISGSVDLKSVNEVHVYKSDSDADKLNTTDMTFAVPAVSDINKLNTSDIASAVPAVSDINKLNTTDMASAVAAVSDIMSLNKLVEEHNHCFVDSSLDELENDRNCPSECLGESDLMEKMGPTKASASGFEAVFCSTNDDYPKAEVSCIVPNSHLDLEVAHGLEFVHAATIQSLEEQCSVDREQDLFNGSDLGNYIPDAPSLPIGYDTEESIVQGKVGLPPSQHGRELLHSGEINSELSSLLPINHQQMLDHDDRKGDNDSAFVFSHVDYRSPLPISELPRLSNDEIDVPEYPKDTLGSIFPSSDPFPETNQINLADLPPLPPLPPVQWRMGKLQHASSSTDGEVMKHKELFPQAISSLGVPIVDVSSSPPITSTDNVGSSPQAASSDDIDSSLEEMKHSLIETAPETASKENVDNSCSSLEANTLHETSDLPPKTENNHQKFAMPISENVFTSPAEEDVVENGSRTVKLPRPHNPLVDDISLLDKRKLRKVTERVRPEIQKVDERDSLLEQIKTKSFNLKPTKASRPSIRGGPNTNLKVAAILEKANAIRQALAGSDEDDDNWSDS